MTDAGWEAIASMIASVCAVVAAIYSGKAYHQAQKTGVKLEEHEEASEERGRAVQAKLNQETQPAVEE